MKCSACRDNKCYGDYDYRHRCVGKKEGVECTCSCQASNGEAVVAAISSIGIGVAATAGGIALTVATGGLFALFGGAALAGAGSSLIFFSIQKKIAGECMTIGDTIKDVAVGATIGAITGPIGASGGALAKGASGAAKLLVLFLEQLEELHRKQQVQFQIQFSDEVTKAVTRVGVQATSAVATDASLQLIQTGTVDPTKLCLNATGQLIVASTAEVSASAAQRTESYANRKNEDL
ncbi:hypothetical protein PVAND_009399 [Polypedilum vanderplanki]|uniref:Uncharacterized protein n=1 Tax=Polypedilum vanderplanki TaxID=319348 RepID=A0A9J6CDZ2_POLVA|nr:hypothetical protein PVAND_009399 [Polypedilum vanderplanki]